MPDITSITFSTGRATTISPFFGVLDNFVGTSQIVEERTEEEIYEMFLTNGTFTRGVERVEELLDSDPSQLIILD